MVRPTGLPLRFHSLRAALVLCAALLAACGDDAPIETDAGPLDAGPADAERLDTGTPDTGPACADTDGDGYASAACGGDDCDDADPARHPGATELCDGDDDDCDDTTLGDDADGDGFVASACCNGTRCGEDCDDARMDVNPRATESCNAGVDDDCDGTADAMDGVCVPCPAGYTGFDADCVDVNECAVADFCGVGAIGCTNLDGSFACRCAPGYAATSATGALCANVDECAAAVNPCGAGDCVDNAGSYVCACGAGYRAVTTPTITCIDVDECTEGTARCSVMPFAPCTNTPGSYACACPAGYEGDGRGAAGCRDVNECAADTDDCDDAPDACRNSVGSFGCACPAGYVGSGRGAGGCLFDQPALSGLDVAADGVLSPAFAPGTTTYTLSVPPGVDATSVVPRVALTDLETITVDGVTVASGASVRVLSGSTTAPRTVEVVVTSESGATRRYTVVLIRRSLYVKASDTSGSDYFGSVALSADGTTLAVGAFGAGVGEGAVYLFRRVAGAWTQEARIEPAIRSPADRFGAALALSGDGALLAVGASTEDSNATGVNGDATDDSTRDAGAVYVFRRSGGTWAQEAYVKASNTGIDDGFGNAVALARDGSALAVGAYQEDSPSTGVNGVATDDTTRDAGAVYVFRRSGGVWAQEAYVKASNTGSGDQFGSSVALSADGQSLAVGAPYEDSIAPGVNGDAGSNSAPDAGAVYVFRRVMAVWSQEAYVKASNTARDSLFGGDVALSDDGSLLAVGAQLESSGATGINADPGGSRANGSGATYLFRRSTIGAWAQEAYVKASNTGWDDAFGGAVALSADGDTLAVGAFGERSNATGVDGDATNDSIPYAGAVYVFRRSGAGVWAQTAYLKASNTDSQDFFGASLALSHDGTTLAVGAVREDSAATGVGGDETDNTATDAGAVYVF